MSKKSNPNLVSNDTVASVKNIKTVFIAVGILALISLLRMFGFFLIMPILSHIADKLRYSTPLLIGVALGIYGLIQAFLYFPLGVLSDKIGRKPVIFMGLILLFFGSIIAAHSTDIYMLIFARSLQGMGAISAVLSAYTADIVDEKYRSRAMMLIGIMVGLSFPLSLILGPIIYNIMGVKGLFYIVAAFSLLAAILTLFLPKVSISNTNTHAHTNSNHKPIKNLNIKRFAMLKTNLYMVLQNKYIYPWLCGVLFLHAISMMFFYIMSFLLEQKYLPLNQQWKFYLPVLTVAFLFSMPLMRRLEKKHLFQQISLISILLIGLTSLGLIFSVNLNFIVFSIVVTIYFIGFNMLEVFQPSILSKMAGDLKGATMGVYYTLQSIGIFIGAGLAGIASQISVHYHMGKHIGIFSTSVFLVLIWLFVNQYLHKIYVVSEVK
jgi:MFS family permease